MVDPVTLTAGEIVILAFREFVKSGAGELAKKFTTEAISKMHDLRELIWNKLRGHPDAESALASIKEGSEDDLNDVATYLKVAMRNDPQFASQVQALAQQINAGKLQDNSNMTQNNYDNAKGWQIKVEGGTSYIGEIHQHSSGKLPNS